MKKTIFFGIICAALAVVAIFTNFFIFPFGEYTAIKENEIFGVKTQVEIKISFNLKGEYKLSLGELEVDGFYKVKDGKVYLGSNKDFEITEYSIADYEIKNFNTIMLTDNLELSNSLMFYIEIGLCVIALLCLLTVFNYDKRR